MKDTDAFVVSKKFDLPGHAVSSVKSKFFVLKFVKIRAASWTDLDQLEYNINKLLKV